MFHEHGVSRRCSLKACHHRRMSVSDDQVRDAIASLLMARVPPATICPSEAARALAPHDWRHLMPKVRAVAFAMANDGALEIRQGGRKITPDGSQRGPIRLGHPFTDARTFGKP